MSTTTTAMRKANTKLKSTTDVLETDLLSRKQEADETVEVDVSDIITSSQFTTIGNNSKVLNLLTLYKAVELSLVYYFGAGRKLKDVNDIDYYKDKYDKLLEKILNGKVKIEDGTTNYTPKSFPAKTSSTYNNKFYPQKGEEGFFNPGVDKDVIDDRYDK